MRIVAALVAALALAGCGADEKIVYVDRESGQVVQPLEMMKHIEPKGIACIGGYQYYVLPAYGARAYEPVRKNKNGTDTYIPTCDGKTLANGEQR